MFHLGRYSQLIVTKKDGILRIPKEWSRRCIAVWVKVKVTAIIKRKGKFTKLCRYLGLSNSQVFATTNIGRSCRHLHISGESVVYRVNWLRCIYSKWNVLFPQSYKSACLECHLKLQCSQSSIPIRSACLVCNLVTEAPGFPWSSPLVTRDGKIVTQACYNSVKFS